MRFAKRLGVFAVVPIVALCCATASSAAASPKPIGPHQYFAGLVNGTHTDAVIYMICPGPAYPGQLGHPEGGQNVSATRAAPGTGGFTGSLAHSIVVTFPAPVSAGAPTTLSFYDTPAAIPTTLLLPCFGTGQVVYTPEPTSPTARSDVVTVTFINLAL